MSNFEDLDSVEMREMLKERMEDLIRYREQLIDEYFENRPWYEDDEEMLEDLLERINTVSDILGDEGF